MVQTYSGYMICLETYGSGCQIGMMLIQAMLLLTRQAHPVGLIKLSAAGLGTITFPRACAPLTASTIIPSIVASISASVVLLRPRTPRNDVNFYPLVFLHSFPPRLKNEAGLFYDDQSTNHKNPSKTHDGEQNP